MSGRVGSVTNWPAQLYFQLQLNFNKLNFTNCFELFFLDFKDILFLLIYCQQITYNVVVASYALSEIPKASLRQMAVRSLWGKTSDFLVSLYIYLFSAKLTFVHVICEVKRTIVYKEMHHAIAKL